MAIPTAKIPVIKAPTQVAPPKINVPQVPSIPLLGSPASDYRNYLQEKADRSSRFFNINDPNQINSVADVVMKTVEGLWNTAKGEDTLGNTFRETIDNSWSLVNNGIIQPIAHRDWAALGLNQLVNVGETIDIVDNIWKGMLMDGTEGIYNASFGRQNYTWDTGNMAVDLGLELLTPTNIALLGLGGVVKGIGKEMANNATSGISNKVIKKFAKAYDGDITSTLVKMQKGINLTKDQAVQLTDIAMHSANLKLLKQLQVLNTARIYTNYVDMIAPKLTYFSTFYPFKQVVKYGFKGSGAVQKYMAKTVSTVIEDITVTNVVKNSAKIGHAIKTMSDAAKLADIDPINIAPFQDILSNVAKVEVRRLKQVFKSFRKTVLNAKVIRQLIDDEFNLTGKALSFDEAKSMHVSNKIGQLSKALDDAAVELSGGTYKNFVEYHGAVSKLYASSAGAGIKVLYDYSSELVKIRNTATVQIVESAINTVRTTIRAVERSIEDIVYEASKEESAVAEIEQVAERLRNLIDAPDSTIDVDAIEASMKYITDTDKVIDLTVHLRNLELAVAKKYNTLSTELTNLTKTTVNLNRIITTLSTTEGILDGRLTNMIRNMASKAGEELQSKVVSINKMITELEKAKGLTQNVEEGVRIARDIAKLSAEKESLGELIEFLYTTPPSKLYAMQGKLQDMYRALVQSNNVVLPRLLAERADLIKNFNIVNNVPRSIKYLQQRAHLQLLYLRGNMQVVTRVVNVNDTKSSATIQAFSALFSRSVDHLDTLIDSFKRARTTVEELLDAGEILPTHAYTTIKVIKDELAKLGKLKRKSMGIIAKDKVDMKILSQYFTDINKLTVSLEDGLDSINLLEGLDKGREAVMTFVNEALSGTGAAIYEKALGELARKHVSKRRKQIGQVLGSGMYYWREFYDLVEDVEKQLAKLNLERDVEMFIPEMDQLINHIDDLNISMGALKENLATFTRLNEEDNIIAVEYMLEETDKLINTLQVHEARMLDVARRSGIQTSNRSMLPGYDVIPAYDTVLSWSYKPYWLDNPLQVSYTDPMKRMTVFKGSGTPPTKFTETKVMNYKYTRVIKSGAAQDITLPLRQLRESLEDFKALFDVPLETELKVSEHNVLSYQLQLNALTRHLRIMSSEEVHDLLDMIDGGIGAYDSALTGVDAVAALDLGKYTALSVALDSNDVVLAKSFFDEIMGDGTPFPADAVSLAAFKDSFTELLDDLNTIKAAALTVMDTLHGMSSVRHLFRLVREQRDVLGDRISYHLLDTLERYYDNPATLGYGGDLTTILTEIVDGVNNQLRNASSAMTFKLENWEHLLPPEGLAEFRSIIPEGMTHTAIADSYLESLVRKYILKNDTLIGKKTVYMDAETNSTNTYNAVLHQQSVVIPEAGIFRLYVNVGVGEGEYASDTVLNLIFNKSGDQKITDVSKLRELYEEIHIHGNMQAFKDHFGIPEDSPIEIIPVTSRVSDTGEFIPSEAALIMDVESFIKAQTPQHGELRISMFNGRSYDAVLWNNRKKEHGITGWLNKSDVDDTLLELESMYNVEKLKPNQIETIAKIINDYIDVRFAELSDTAERTAVSLDEFDSVFTKGKFLPRVDQSFRDALIKLNDYFAAPFVNKHSGVAGMAKLHDFHSNVYVHRATHPDLQHFRKFTDAVKESVNSIMKDQEMLDGYQLHVAPVEDADKIMDYVKRQDFSSRIVTEETFSGIPHQQAAVENIALDMMTLNGVKYIKGQGADGLFFPTFGVRKLVDKRAVYDWFDIGDFAKLGQSNVERMTQMAKRFYNTVNAIKNIKAASLYTDEAGTVISDPARAMQELKEIQRIIVQEITTMVGGHNIAPVIKDLKERHNLLEQYAITHEIWKTYKALLKDLKQGDSGYTDLYKTLEVTYKERIKDIDKPGRVIYSIVGQQDTAKAFELLVNNDELKPLIDHFILKAQREIKSMEDLEKMFDTGLSTTPLKRMAPVYEQLYESFILAKSIADKTENPELAYAYLRMPMEAMNEITAYSKLTHTLQKTPEELASYLWHHGNGIMMFEESSLATRNYFKRRNNINSVDPIISEDALMLWKDIMKNKSAYEAQGIKFVKSDTWWYVYLDSERLSEYKTLPFIKHTEDFDIEPFLNVFIDAYAIPYSNVGINIVEVKNMMRSALKARQHIMKLTPDAVTSTLEHMDPKVMEKLLYQMSHRTPGALTLDMLRANNRFAGNIYNHSVLGSIDSRRKLMPYASFIPSKTMFRAAEMAHSRISKQVQFTLLLQDPTIQVANILKHATKEEVFEYLQNATHLKLAFVQSHAKKGFKVSPVIVNSPKDIEWAASVNAVILDRLTYVKAYEVINQNKIPEGLWKLLDRGVVAPFKIGWMGYNSGTVFRNFADSGLKNLQSTGDLAIVPEMLRMLKVYWDYKKDIKEILQLARGSEKQIQDKGRQLKEIIADYFASGKNRVSREDFEMLTEFKNSGSSSGMVREMQEYYGGAIDRLYRSVDETKSGLNIAEFRELMRMPDDVARAWLERIPGLDVEKLMATKLDLYYYKRAYAMHSRKTAKLKHMSVEDFVVLLKRGDAEGYIDPLLKADVDKLLQDTTDVKVTESLFDKIMANPLVDHALDLNAGIEEVMRLAMFKHLRGEGYSISEAMSEIIKTHFDYGHKTQAQMYLEMVAPFSTFRINSFLYWVDQLSQSSMGMEIVAKYWRESSNVDERDPEDYYLRRGLQYQMLSGNPVLNEESGLTLKLSPSVMDAMEFVRDPIGYAGRSLFMVEEVKTFIEMEPYAGESEERYKERKRLAASKLIPVVGSIYAREVGSVRTLPILNQLIAPLVNRTWTPEQRVQKPRFYYAQNQKSRYTAAKIRRARFSSYSPFNKIYYSAMYRTRNGIPYGTKAFRSVNRWHKSAWSRTMSSKHKQKYALLSFPTNKYTLKMKVQLLRRLAAVR